MIMRRGMDERGIWGEGGGKGGGGATQTNTDMCVCCISWGILTYEYEGTSSYMLSTSVDFEPFDCAHTHGLQFLLQAE